MLLLDNVTAMPCLFVALVFTNSYKINIKLHLNNKIWHCYHNSSRCGIPVYYHFEAFLVHIISNGMIKAIRNNIVAKLTTELLWPNMDQKYFKVLNTIR